MSRPHRVGCDRSARASRREVSAGPPVAFYVHVPFCLSICPYCDFAVVAGRAARRDAGRVAAFVAAVRTELDLRADGLDRAYPAGRPALQSVYLGGGTPSLLAPAEVAGLLDHVARRFGIAAAAEITLEVNPGRADRGDLRGFHAAGIDRLSLGVQSLHAGDLRALGRRHTPSDVVDAVSEARAAGFGSVNMDLLYDVPGQSLASWRSTLDAALALEPEHVSAYALSLDDPDAEGLTGPFGDHLPLRRGARAWRDRARGSQDQDRAAEQYEAASDRLAGAGLRRYELSNWARPEHESRHDLAYWHRDPVEALGPGAHAFDGDSVRRWNAAPLEPYLAALSPSDGRPAGLPPGGEERLDPDEARAEAAILGLRLPEGLDQALLVDPALEPGLRWGLATGLLVDSQGRLRLTPRGRLLGSELFMRLLPAPAADPGGQARRGTATLIAAEIMI